MRKYDDPVEVRRGADEGPEQFLWRGRLWQVREVVGHWVETRPWFLADDPDPVAEQQVWRVTAARGISDRGLGVFDLCFDWSTGDWRLAGAVD